MEGKIPGFVPAVLQAPGVSLFRAEDRTFDAMVDGWTAQMLARGLAVNTIKDRLSLIRRFQAFTNDYPWNWNLADYEEFLAERRSGPKPLSLTTLRTDANMIGMFCAYLTDPAYRWTDF